MKYTGKHLAEEEKTPTMKDTCLSKFTVAVSIRARNWKQPRCLTTYEYIMKIFYIYKVEYYSPIKKNEICK